jgi:hypothetical protein
MRSIFYQLWCYYETKNEWKMDGLFRSPGEAFLYLNKLRDNLEAPGITDWAIVEVTGSW